jgi:hypothetical protein
MVLSQKFWLLFKNTYKLILDFFSNFIFIKKLFYRFNSNKMNLFLLLALILTHYTSLRIQKHKIFIYFYFSFLFFTHFSFYLKFLSYHSRNVKKMKHFLIFIQRIVWVIIFLLNVWFFNSIECDKHWSIEKNIVFEIDFLASRGKTIHL